MALYKISSTCPLAPDDIEIVVVDADNDAEAVELVRDLIPGDSPSERLDRQRWLDSIVLDYLGVSRFNPARGVVAIQRIRL